MVRLYLGVGILFVSLILIACGGGEEAQPTPTPTAEVQAPAPTATAAPTATPEPAVLTLAFIRDGDIWLVDAAGNNRRRISDFGSTDREVVSFRWVAKGQEIAYEVSLRLEPGTASPSTFTSVLANADGGVLWERELPQFAGVFWSPDGQLVAVFSEGAVSIEDRAGRSVWTGTAAPPAPPPFRGTWSPDGKAFAFGDGSELVVVSRDGTNVSRLYGGPGFDAPKEGPPPECPVSLDESLLLGEIVFSPGGQTIFVAVNCHRGSGAYAYTIIRELSLDAVINRLAVGPVLTGLPTPSFSPDGSRIALVEGVKGVPCSSNADAFANMELDILDPNEGDGSQLMPRGIAQLIGDLATEGPAADIHISAVWSPASDAIVASFSATECVCFDFEAACAVGNLEDRHRVLAEGVYLLRIDGVADEKITEGFSETVSWSPSGNLIAYVTGEPDAPQIRLFDLATGDVTDLGPGIAPAWRPLPPEVVSLPWEGAVTDNLRIRSEPSTASDTVG
ncbi:MAG: PD40 domain-containing protein, partial [Chloroflexi bacterium]|nr:PD40 domain-containing protein [Chloroflexota bacterium]